MAYPGTASYGGGLAGALVGQRKTTAPIKWTYASQTPFTGTKTLSSPWQRLTGGGGAQSNPYAGLTGGQPDLSAFESEFAAGSAADAASRDAAIKKMLVSYGQIPDFGGLSESSRGYLNNALDPATRAAAEKAEAEGLSIHARQAAGNEKATRYIPAQLAARGMFRSGQTGTDLKDQAQNYKIQQYDTLNELLGGIEGTVGNFLSGERDRNMQLAQMRMQAAWNAFSNWGGSYDTGGGSGSGGYNTGVTQRAGTARAPSVYRSSQPGSQTWSGVVKNWQGGGI